MVEKDMNIYVGFPGYPRQSRHFHKYLFLGWRIQLGRVVCAPQAQEVIPWLDSHTETSAKPVIFLCKTSNFVEIAEGENLTRSNITKYFEDLNLSLTYAVAALAKRSS